MKRAAIWGSIIFLFSGVLYAHNRAGCVELRSEFTEHDIKEIWAVLEYNKLHSKPLDYTFGDIKSLDNVYVDGDYHTGDIEVRRNGWKITIDKDGTITREKEGVK